MGSVKLNIKKILLGVLWLVLGTGMIVLLVAAINKKNSATCKGIEIEIKGITDNFFLNKQDVIQLLTPAGNKPVFKGKNIASFNLQKLERVLENNLWIRDAELFFDNNEVLQVVIDEREPIARIFTVAGNSYYIDSSLERLPLSDKMSARLPVFTNFPSEKTKWRGADSLLMSQVKSMSQYIQKDDFWSAQVAQVDITPQRNFEIVPAIGSYVIEMGDGENIENKFNRLMLFYKQVLVKTGFNKYTRILVQYNNQIVGVKKGRVTKFDSLQVLKNIQKLIQTSQKMQIDSLFTSVDKKNISNEKGATPLAVLEKQDNAKPAEQNIPNNPSLMQRPTPSYDPLKKPVVKDPPKEKSKPKAVMKKA